MRQVLKWLGIGLGILVGVLVVAVASAVLRGNSKLDQRYTIEPEAVNIPADATSIERGQYLGRSVAPAVMGDDLGGAPSSRTRRWAASRTESDDRRRRRGVDLQRRRLRALDPSWRRAGWESAGHHAGAGLLALQRRRSWRHHRVAAQRAARRQRSRRAVDQPAAAPAHRHRRHEDSGRREHRPHGCVPTPARQVDAGYGEYLVNTNDCRQCHGAPLTGGQSSEPGAPASLLGEGGAACGRRRSSSPPCDGVTPDGRPLDARFMPWGGLRANDRRRSDGAPSLSPVAAGDG